MPVWMNFWTGVRFSSHPPKKTTSFYRNLSFSVIFALLRVILLRSDIRLKPSDIALRAVLVANIISLLRQQKYHFYEMKISLCLKAQYHLICRSSNPYKDFLKGIEFVHPFQSRGSTPNPFQSLVLILN